MGRLQSQHRRQQSDGVRARDRGQQLLQLTARNRRQMADLLRRLQLPDLKVPEHCRHGPGAERHGLQNNPVGAPIRGPHLRELLRPVV